jgi:hypothetical protein
MTYLNHPTKTIIPPSFIAIGLEDCSYRNDECGSLIHPDLERFGVFPAYDVETEECPVTPNKWFIFDYDASDTLGIFKTSEVVEWFQTNLDALKEMEFICDWCRKEGDDFRETALGKVCQKCVRAIESKGEKL